MVRRAQASGDVYQGVYSGWFCTGCNEFKTDQQLVNGRCPDHPSLEPLWLEENNYFFRLSAYQERLERLYAENPSFCEPEHFRNEVLGWLKDGLRDFSISRSGATWGIPFPGDPGHRIYVWFDALTNYVTGAGFPNDPAGMEKWWPADLHVIGKNITRFHCLYWPAMLMSAGLPLPKQVFAHGFMLDRGEKMSKTAGNVRDPDETAETFGVDGVRYMVLREVPFDRDADVSTEAFVRRYNADLANDLGNLVNRTVSMSRRYLDGRLPPVTDATQAADRELQATAERVVAAYHDAMERHHLHEALAAMMELAQAANGYAEGQAPWSLVKAGDEARAGQVLAVMAEACRFIGHLLAPVAPTGARTLLEQLGAPPPVRRARRRRTGAGCARWRGAAGRISGRRGRPSRSSRASSWRSRPEPSASTGATPRPGRLARTPSARALRRRPRRRDRSRPRGGNPAHLRPGLGPRVVGGGARPCRPPPRRHRRRGRRPPAPRCRPGRDAPGRGSKRSSPIRARERSARSASTSTATCRRRRCSERPSRASSRSPAPATCRCSSTTATRTRRPRRRCSRGAVVACFTPSAATRRWRGASPRQASSSASRCPVAFGSATGPRAAAAALRGRGLPRRDRFALPRPRCRRAQRADDRAARRRGARAPARGGSGGARGADSRRVRRAHRSSRPVNGCSSGGTPVAIDRRGLMPAHNADTEGGPYGPGQRQHAEWWL